MLAETERNREMCNQIVRRVFPDPTKTNELPHPVGPLVSNTLLSVLWLTLRSPILRLDLRSGKMLVQFFSWVVS